MVSGRWTGYTVFQIVRKTIMAAFIATLPRQVFSGYDEKGLKTMNLACSYCEESLVGNEPFVTVLSGELMHLFCSTKCRDLYGVATQPHRICAREGCKNKVPKVNRMLCHHCHQKGSNFGEVDPSFDEKERAHWKQAEQALLNRINAQVRVFKARDMSQKDLRALVPSLQGEAE